MLETIFEEIQNLEKVCPLLVNNHYQRALVQNQPQIVKAVVQICIHGCGESILRSLREILTFLYTNADFTKIGDFFEQILPPLQSSKSPSQSKM